VFLIVYARLSFVRLFIIQSCLSVPKINKMNDTCLSNSFANLQKDDGNEEDLISFAKYSDMLSLLNMELE